MTTYGVGDRTTLSPFLAGANILAGGIERVVSRSAIEVVAISAVSA